VQADSARKSTTRGGALVSGDAYCFVWGKTCLVVPLDSQVSASEVLVAFQVQLKLDLVFDGGAILAELGNLWLEPTCLPDGTLMDRHLRPAYCAIEREPTSIVVGGDEPETPTSGSACKQLNRFKKSMTDAFPTDTGNENDDLTLVSLDSIQKQAHRHTIALGHKAGER